MTSNSSLWSFWFGNQKKEESSGSESSSSSSSSENEEDKTLDLIRHKWVKAAFTNYKKESTHTCHIFDFVEKQHGNLPWGHVLDAGSGTHSLEWICSMNTDRWTALTGDNVMKKSISKHFANEMRNKDRILVGNWKDPKLFEGEVFDVVIADYLLGSLDAFAPYYQDRLFERIRPHVGKRLYVTGAEPLPDRADGNPQGQLVIEIAKARDSCILLAGERPYREYPMDWVLRNLKHCGYRIISVGFFANTVSRGYIENQVRVGETKIKKFKNDALASQMKKYLGELYDKVSKTKWNVEFGSDYVVVAEPLQNIEKQDTTNSELLQRVKYKSAVQEQQEVYPIDED